MKNVKKYLFYFIILIVGIFVYGGQVYAADCDKYACATCVYKNSYGTYTYDIKANGDGTVSVSFNAKNVANTTSTNNIGDSYFINSSTNKIECYPIYSKVTASGRSVKVSLSSTDSGQAGKLAATSESKNNGKLLTVEDNTKYISCDYSDNLSTCTITSTESKITSSCTGGFTLNNNELNVSDFQYGTSCPKASLTCSNKGGKYCSLLKPESIGSNNTQQGTESETGDKINVGNGSNIVDKYTCSYIGQVDGKKLLITKTDTKWEIVYPSGYGKDFSIGKEGNNIFPSSDCEDVFYSESSNSITMIDDDSQYMDVQIAQYCRSNSDLEQFCEYGACQIDKPLCGNENIGAANGNNYGSCPQELKPIIFFIKKIAFNTLQIFVPILLIVMGSIDMLKAVMSSDDKGNREAISKFIQRALAAVLCFFIVTIVTIVMDMFTKTDVGEQNDWKACWHNID